LSAVNASFKKVNDRLLLNEIEIRTVQPGEVTPFDSESEGFVLVSGTVGDFVHLVELSLEQYKLLSGRRCLVNAPLLELFEGIDNFKEVISLQEESVVSFIDSSNNFFDWEHKSILIKVSFQLFVAIFFKFVSVLLWLNSNNVLGQRALIFN